jgi:hypothetical protein
VSWVVNFTTVPVAEFGEHPFGPFLDDKLREVTTKDVHVMHVWHDAGWARAEIHTKDSKPRHVDLTRGAGTRLVLM